MIILLSSNFLILVTAFLVATALLRFKKSSEIVIASFLVYLGQIILVELFAGLLGTLYLRDLIALHLCIFAWVWYKVPSKDFSLLKQIKDDLFDIVTLNRFVFFGFCALFAFGLAKIILNLMNFPLGPDSLNYHFTQAVEWLKHGNLDIPITIADDPSPSYYPINGSLYYLWLALPLKNVFIADLGQIPFFLASLVAVYAIGRKLGLNKEEGVYASLLFLLIPNYFKQLEVAYVDVMVAALFLAAVYYLIALAEEFNWGNSFLFATAVGLLVGTKTIACPYSLLLIIPFAYLAIRNLREYKISVAAILLVLIFGGFSYIRNYIDTGNPLYPLDFFLMGKRVFKGVMDTKTYAAHFKIEDYRISKLLFHEGLGVQVLFFVFSGIILSLPLALFGKLKCKGIRLYCYVFIPLGIYLLYRFVIPLANSRYLYPALGLGLICGLTSAGLFKLPLKFLRWVFVLCVFASVAEIAGNIELVTAFILMAFIFITYRKVKNIRSFGIKRIVIFSVVAVLSLLLLEQIYLRSEYKSFTRIKKYSGYDQDLTNAWSWLNQHTVGNNIAYTGRPLPFPLYGSSFKNNVYYVSINATEPAKLHYFPDSRYRWGYDFKSEHNNFTQRGNYRENADYKTWLNNLNKRHTELLFVYSLHQVDEVIFPIEDSWARAKGSKFSLVFSNNTVRIYKVKR